MAIVLIIWLLCAELCAWIAVTRKKRSWHWFFLGLIFGPVALFYLLFRDNGKN
jgi:hypothetical protein